MKNYYPHILPMSTIERQVKVKKAFHHQRNSCQLHQQTKKGIYKRDEVLSKPECMDKEGN